MFDLKLLSARHETLPKEPLYLSKGSSTDEKRIIYTKGTTSIDAQTFGKEPWFQHHGLTSSDIFSTIRSKHIPNDEIVVVPLRELSYEDAKREIVEYIQQAGGRKVYISELAENLMLDIELIIEIIEELGTEELGTD